MIFYRITTRRYKDDISGTGAMLFGGRWNTKGTQMLYTSGTLSLAMLETIANLSSTRFHISLYVQELSLLDAIEIATPDHLPDGWDSFPHSADTMRIGRDFVKNDGFCLKVPSAIVPTEYNYLFNPLHHHFDKLQIVDARPLIIDNRIIDTIIP